MTTEVNPPLPAIILLAAGASTRLGRPKQLLKFRGKTFLRHSIETALASVGRPVIVVLGANAEQITPEAEGLPVTSIANPQWQEGMASSIRAGLNAATGQINSPRSVILMLCDQPFVTAAFLNQLAAVHQAGGYRIVAAEYGGGGGVPALFDRSLFPELAALTGIQGAKPVIVRYAKESHWIQFPEAAIDIDYEEDVERLASLRWAGSGTDA